MLRRSLALLVLALTPVVGRAAETAARAGSVEVSIEEIRTLIDTLPARDQAALTKDPAVLSQFVRGHITRKVLLSEAAAKKFEQQPGVKTQLDRAREQALLDLFLEFASKPPDGYPSDAEVLAAYEASKAALQVPAQFRVAQVYVALPKGADKAAEEKAKRKVEDLAKKLKAKGADFATIAKSESEDAQTAAKGGEIGWLTEAQLVPGTRATVLALAKDAVSEPVHLDDGWHVLKLLDQKAAGSKPLAEVRDAFVAQLRAAKARDLRQAYLAKILEQNPPAINELVLTKLVQKAK